MTDLFSKKKRSEIMSRVRARNTKPELSLKNLIDRRIIKYQPNGILGSPDFANKKKKVAIFVDGCFWHGCRKCKSIPKKNNEFWRDKIERNRKRDKRDANRLRKEGWKVIRVWEHSIKKDPIKVITRIMKYFK